MEQYFEITKDSPHYEEYFSWLKNRGELREAYEKFRAEHGIVGTLFACDSKALYIEDNKENREKFTSQLKMSSATKGVIALKANSKLLKKWRSLSLKFLDKPCVPLFFNTYVGTSFSKLFDHEGNLYCSFNYPYGEKAFEAPEGFIELSNFEFRDVLRKMEEVR